jgi:hypothetical protein
VTERVLKKNCLALESRAARLKEVLPMCEQVMRLRIGFSELVAFHPAVMKRADFENISTESAAYRVMEEIESYSKLGGMKEQLVKVGNQLFITNEILGRRKAYGVTDDEILNFHELLNSTRNQRVGQLTR